jgi:hypothetical protein
MAKKNAKDSMGGEIIILTALLTVGGFGAWKIYKNKKAKEQANELKTGA